MSEKKKSVGGDYWEGGAWAVMACMFACAVRVLISKCWHYTGLSCFLSPVNPTAQKPQSSRGSQQLRVTRHGQYGEGWTEPLKCLLANATSSLWHNRYTTTHPKPQNPHTALRHEAPQCGVTHSRKQRSNQATAVMKVLMNRKSKQKSSLSFMMQSQFQWSWDFL